MKKLEEDHEKRQAQIVELRDLIEEITNIFVIIPTKSIISINKSRVHKQSQLSEAHVLKIDFEIDPEILVLQKSRRCMKNMKCKENLIARHGNIQVNNQDNCCRKTNFG